MVVEQSREAPPSGRAESADVGDRSFVLGRSVSPADGEGSAAVASERRLWLLASIVSALGLVGAAAVVAASGWALGSMYLVVVFVAATAFTRILPFVVLRAGEGEEVSADDALLVVMLVALPSLGVLVASLAGTAVAHVYRRRGALKTVYNHAVQILSLAAAIGVHGLVTDADLGARSARDVLAAGAGAITYSVLSACLTWLVVARASQTPFRLVMRDGLGTHALTIVFVVGWGVLAVGVTSHDAAAAALVAVPMTGSWLLHRDERQRASMQALFDTAVVVGKAVRHGTVAVTLADAADRVLGRDGSRVQRRPPGPGEVGAQLTSRSGPLWLVAGRRHPWDQRHRDDRVVLGALAAIGEIALENAVLLDAAGRDPDTGLMTGALLQDRLQVLLEDHADVGATLVVVRVPRLNVVKRTLGPVVARRVVAEVSGRLRRLDAEIGRSGEMPSVVGYLGDGDFTVAVFGVTTPERALGIARVIQRELVGAIEVDGVELAIEAAIGVRTHAPTPSEAAEAARLVRDAVSGAETAARRNGLHRIELVSASPQEASVFAAETRLRRAMANDELVVHYQPVVSMSTGLVVGAEALVRWQDPERGVVAPGDFVPVAEGSILIVDLDRYVLRHAIAQLASWSHRQGFTIAVNLSAAHLAEPDTADFVSRLLDAAGVEGRRLTVEVTESSVMTEASSALATLEALAEQGVGIAVDDFGTGYSSLLYLRDFPVGELKIDRSFVSRMTDSGGDAAIVTAIVRLAQTLGLSTVAEGVETDEQLAALRALGCDAGQGFLWDRAVDAHDFEAHWLSLDQAGAVGPTHAVATGASARNAPAPWLHESVRDDELAYVVHELRSPLTAIDGFAYLAAHEVDELDDPGELPDYLDHIHRGLRTMQELIDALHDSSTANLGGMALDLQLTEIIAVVQATLDAMTPALDPHPIRLHAGEPAQVSVDRSRIAQVLRNLLSNAAKFSEPDDPIVVSITTSGGRCMVTVRDHGVGVPPERRQELFRRFARLGATTKGTGMGMGLHLARTIARRHGGDVTYQPPPEGTGSSFTLELPTISDEKVAASPPGSDS